MMQVLYWCSLTLSSCCSLFCLISPLPTLTKPSRPLPAGNSNRGRSAVLGEHVAVVGASGAGKSTLAAFAAPRFLSPPRFRGPFAWMAKSIAEIPIAVWLDQVGSGGASKPLSIP